MSLQGLRVWQVASLTKSGESGSDFFFIWDGLREVIGSSFGKVPGVGVI
jgi:hypothetical protein